MKLEEINLLLESTAELKKEIERLFKECSKKYFSGIKQKFPNPTFKVTNSQKNFGLYNPNDNSITIYAELQTTEKGLRSTVFHETIHFWDFDYDHNNFKKDKGHGEFFKKYMKKINSVEGKDFINISSSKSSKGLLKTAKPFYIYWCYSNDEYHTFWNQKLDPGLLYKAMKIAKYNKADEYFIAKTSLAPLQLGPKLMPKSKKTAWYDVSTKKEEFGMLDKLEPDQTYSVAAEEENMLNYKVTPFWIYYAKTNNEYLLAWSKKGGREQQFKSILSFNYDNLDIKSKKTDLFILQPKAEFNGIKNIFIFDSKAPQYKLLEKM